MKVRDIVSQHLLRMALFVLLGAWLLVSLLLVPSEAQIAPPITASGLNTQISAPINLPGGKVQHNITGGTRPGNGPNLFHSFGEFGVAGGTIANFFNETGRSTTNILSRVTGGNPSNIFGTIQTTGFGNANLFLMNPAGIVFGPNATLNVGGSVHFTTADYFRLADGMRFNAIPGMQDTILSTAPVTAFGFLNPHSVNAIQGGGSLQVPQGNTFSYVVGDFSMQGGAIQTVGGRVNLVSVKSPGEVLFPTMEFAPNINGQAFTALGTITLSQNARIDAGGGTVVIRGGRLVVADNSSISSGQLGGANGPATAVDIRMTEDVSVTSGGSIVTGTVGAGKGGDIQINAGTVRVTDNGSFVGSFGGEAGDSGSIIISANTGVEVMNNGFIGTQPAEISTGSGRSGDVSITSPVITVSGGLIASQTFAAGKGGDVHINAETVKVTDGGFVGSFGGGAGDSGSIIISASRGVEVMNNGFIGTDVAPTSVGGGRGGDVRITSPSITVSNMGLIGSHTFGDGSAGNLMISTGSLEVTAGGAIGSESFGAGNAGNVNIFATGAVSITGAGSNLFSKAIADGSAGTVRVSGRNSLSFADSAQINATAAATGRAGNVFLQSDDAISINGAAISTSTFGTGRAGDIELEAHGINIMGNKSGLFSTSSGSGVAGNVKVFTGNFELKGGASIDSSTSGIGSGGGIILNVRNLTVSGSAKISSSSTGTGNAGNISITAADRFVMQDSKLTTQATVADGGNITISAGKVVQLISSSITTSVGTGSGNGGNITIDPQFVILQSGSQILANAFGGNGGNINIAAGLLLISPDSIINASSALGVSGTITINSAISDLSGSLTPLPQGFLRKGLLLNSRCAARVGGSNSSFVVAGREAIPMEPGGLLPSPIHGAGEMETATAPGDAVLVALNLATETIAGGCAK